MAVQIKGVEKGSIAYKNGIKAGDILVKINGEEINDMLDLQFYQANRNLEILITSAEGEDKTVIIADKDEYDTLGLEFETYLNGQRIHHDDIAKGISEILHKSECSDCIRGFGTFCF